MTRDELMNLIARDDRVAVSALLALYDRQTADERDAGVTEHHNGVGFSGVDAPILTDFARQVLRWRATPLVERDYAAPLSPRQMKTLRRCLARYGRQLLEIAEEKEAARTARAAQESLPGTVVLADAQPSRFRSSEGTQFDRDAGCRRCWLADVPLNAERHCAHCAQVQAVAERGAR